MVPRRALQARARLAHGSSQTASPSAIKKRRRTPPLFLSRHADVLSPKTISLKEKRGWIQLHFFMDETREAFKAVGRAIGHHHVRWPLSPFQRRGVMAALMTSTVPRWGVRGHINALEMGLGKTLIEMIHAMIWRSITPQLPSPWLEGVGTLDRARVHAHMASVHRVASSTFTSSSSCPIRYLLVCEMNSPVHPSTFIVSENAVHASWIENMTKHIPRTVQIVEYARKKSPDEQTEAPFLFMTYSMLGLLANTVEQEAQREGWKAQLDHAPDAVHRDALRRKFIHALSVKDKATLIFATTWNLVIMDEAHNARTPSSAMWKGASSITARAKRLVTGTMINNQLSDLSVLFGLLECNHPYILEHAQSQYSKSDMKRVHAGLTLDVCAHAALMFCNVREHDMDASALTPCEASPSIWIMATLFLPWSFKHFLKCVQDPYTAWEVPYMVTDPKSRHVSDAMEAVEQALGVTGPMASLVATDPAWSACVGITSPEWIMHQMLTVCLPLVRSGKWQWSDLPCASPLDARRLYARCLVASASDHVDWSPVVMGHSLLSTTEKVPPIDRRWCLENSWAAIACLDRYIDMVTRLETYFTALVDALCDAIVERNASPEGSKALDAALFQKTEAMKRAMERSAARKKRPRPQKTLFHKKLTTQTKRRLTAQQKHVEGLDLPLEEELEQEEDTEEVQPQQQQHAFVPIQGAPGIIQFIVRAQSRMDVDYLARRDIEQCLMANIRRVREGLSQSYGDMLACNTYAQTASVHPDVLRYHPGRTKDVIRVLKATQSPGAALTPFMQYMSDYPVPHDNLDDKTRLTPAQHAEREAWFEAAHTRCESAKMKFLKQYMLHNVKEDEKVVIFSRYRGCIAVLRGYVERVLNHRTMTLAARETAEQRHAMISQFNTSTPSEFKVLFVSTRGNGVGINITRANHAFVFDPWYNPRLDDQALMRIHRPGQTRYTWRCVVISHESYEHAIYLLGAEKSMIGYRVTGSKAQQRRHLEVDASDVEAIKTDVLKKRIDALEMKTATANDILHSESGDFAISKRIVGLAQERWMSSSSSSSTAAPEMTSAATTAWSEWIRQCKSRMRMSWSIESHALPEEATSDALYAAAEHLNTVSKKLDETL